MRDKRVDQPRQKRRRHEAEQGHRRQHILLAAEQVFSRRPYDEATMQEIAAEAGIGMNGLYQQFASKEELRIAVLSLRLGEIGDRIHASTAPRDPLTRLRELATAYAGFFLERPQFFPIYAMQKLSVDWALRSRFTQPTRYGIRQIEAEPARAIAAAVESDLTAPLDAGLLTAVALGVFASVVQYHLLAGKPVTAEECADEIARICLMGLGPQPPAAQTEPRKGPRA